MFRLRKEAECLRKMEYYDIERTRWGVAISGPGVKLEIYDGDNTDVVGIVEALNKAYQQGLDDGFLNN